MALINCPECGKEISDQVSNCPHCGYPIKKKKRISLPKIKVRYVVIPLILIVAIIVGVIIWKSVLNTPLNRAISAYKNDRVEDFKEAKSEMNEDDRLKLGDYLSEQLDEVLSNYLDGKLDYDSANKVITKVNEYGNTITVKNYNDVVNQIKNLNASQKAYEAAQDYEKAGDPVKAYESYNEVISEDSNYDVAQEKKATLINEVVDLLKSSASGAASHGDYEQAIADIKEAQEYASNNTELDDLLKKYTDQQSEKERKEQEEREQKERAEREKLLLYDNKTIYGKSIQATFQGASLTREIHPNNTSGFHMYYTPMDDSDIYLDLKFRIKNTGSSSKHMDEIVADLKATYNDSYDYNSYNLFYSDSDDIDTVYSWDTLSPLEATTLHIAVSLPSEVKNSGKSLVVEFIFDGEKQILEYQ